MTTALTGFFDLSDRCARLDTKKDPLAKIDAVVPWEEFCSTPEWVWRKPDAEGKSRSGRNPVDAMLMFKMLKLSALYNLSDDQIEYQMRDRLSLMCFLGLGREDRVPDAKKAWLYREPLNNARSVVGAGISSVPASSIGSCLWRGTLSRAVSTLFRLCGAQLRQ